MKKLNKAIAIAAAFAMLFSFAALVAPTTAQAADTPCVTCGGGYVYEPGGYLYYYVSGDRVRYPGEWVASDSNEGFVYWFQNTVRVYTQVFPNHGYLPEDHPLLRKYEPRLCNGAPTCPYLNVYCFYGDPCERIIMQHVGFYPTFFWDDCEIYITRVENWSNRCPSLA